MGLYFWHQAHGLVPRSQLAGYAGIITGDSPGSGPPSGKTRIVHGRHGATEQEMK
jgi:hypothetical protein